MPAEAPSVAQDLEPEYIAVSSDSKKAWIALQENNAVAILNIPAGRITHILPLGFKSYSLPTTGLDASNKDGAINIAAYAGLFGMYQPDAIAAFEIFGKQYLITANEGDARDYDGFSEEKRVKDLALDPETESPRGKPLLVVGYEVSGSTSIYEINSKNLLSSL